MVATTHNQSIANLQMPSMAARLFAWFQSYQPYPQLYAHLRNKSCAMEFRVRQHIL